MWKGVGVMCVGVCVHACVCVCVCVCVCGTVGMLQASEQRCVMKSERLGPLLGPASL